MKVDELRRILLKYDQDTTRKLVVEMYKIIPKKVREDTALDEFISTFTSMTGPVRKTKSEQDLIIDFDILKSEAVAFIEYASMSYYYAPNRIVPKTARSKWRVTARKLLKSLIAVKGENTEEAAQLLIEMYRMLSYACGTFIFSTENPFSAVGFKQPDLLDIILTKLFSSGVTQETLRLAVFVVLESRVDRETLHSELMVSLLRQLKTVDARELALEECSFFIKSFKDATKRPYKSRRFLLTYDRKGWDIDYSDSVSEDCAELYLRLSIALHEYDKGIRFFRKYFRERDPEVNLFCLLMVLRMYTDSNPTLVEKWIEIYDKAVEAGITPRKKLAEWRTELEDATPISQE